jgi:hypothetical protein
LKRHEKQAVSRSGARRPTVVGRRTSGFQGERERAILTVARSAPGSRARRLTVARSAPGKQSRSEAARRCGPPNEGVSGGSRARRLTVARSAPLR